MCLCLSAWAVTQEGVVRTISRKGHPGTPVDGAVIRVRGSHNAVQSHADGNFEILLYNLQNGDPYAIASIIKGGEAKVPYAREIVDSLTKKYPLM